MASEMVERVVAAMRETGLDCSAWPDDVMTELARAAIAAMREPTAGMVKAGEQEFFEYRAQAEDWTLAETKNAWSAMIDAALAEPPAQMPARPTAALFYRDGTPD